MTDHAAVAVQYAEDVLAGEVPAAKTIHMAAERFLSFMDREDIDWEPAQVRRVCRFIEALPHTKGRWRTQKKLLRLEPWQVFMIAGIFGFWRDGMRLTTSTYIEIPRKNGKSAIAAAIGLYTLLESKESGAEVYSGATTQDQAFEVFRPMQEMVRISDDLRSFYDVRAYGKSIAVSSTGSRAMPLVGNPGDGGSPSTAIIDEFHEHKTSDLFDTMLTGMGARGGTPDGDEPLLLCITTAGDNQSGPCFARRGDAMAILNGDIADDRQFVLIYTIDDDDEWNDWDSVVKANPNLGVSVNPDFLKAQLAAAERSAERQAVFQIKHLNRWVGSKRAFINLHQWRGLVDAEVPLEGLRAWVGIDLASKRDITAVVALIQGPDGILHVRPKFFCPEETDNATWLRLAAEGHLELTPGASTDYALVEDHTRSLLTRYSVQQVGFDEWQANYLATRLQGRGVPMISFPHQVRYFSDPTKEIEALIADQAIRHDDNLLMNLMMGSVQVKVDAKENLFPTKARPHDPVCKIDGFVALVMATGLYLREKQESGILDYFSGLKSGSLRV